MRGHVIPPMTHPLSSAWDQPDTSRFLVDDEIALCYEEDFKQLPEYSRTWPTGAYEGKMWSTLQEGVWYLRWYGPPTNGNPKDVSVNHRPVLFL